MTLAVLDAELRRLLEQPPGLADSRGEHSQPSRVTVLACRCRGSQAQSYALAEDNEGRRRLGELARHSASFVQ